MVIKLFLHMQMGLKKKMSNLQKENRVELKEGLIIVSKLVGVCQVKTS